jgi:group I intron endonuclease
MTTGILKTWALYKITNRLNEKIYVGQTIEPTKRWYQHRRDAASPKYPIHFAINKYGVHNFEFEVIATCLNQDDANFLEENLIKQYNSLAKDGKGYNISLGGMVAPKSEEWKQSMRDWHASLTPEERARISKKQADATLNQIATQDHPAQGTKRTDEKRVILSHAQQNRNNDYTLEIRQKMSEAHIGIKDSDETKKNKAESAKAAWEKRQSAAIASGELKCNAPGCTVSGVITGKYYFVNDIRYCSKHAQRLKRTGTL